MTRPQDLTAEERTAITVDFLFRAREVLLEQHRTAEASAVDATLQLIRRFQEKVFQTS